MNVSVRADGQYQVGNETLDAKQFEAKLNELAAAKFSGNFKIGDSSALSLSEVASALKGGKMNPASLTLEPPASTGALAFDPEKVDRKLESFAQLMNDVFKLIAETASTERKSAREGRHAAQAAEQADIASQVEKMKDAASKAFEGALIQGIIGIASGALNAVISVVSAGVSIGGAAATVGAAAKGASTAAQETAKGATQATQETAKGATKATQETIKTVVTALEGATQAASGFVKSAIQTADGAGGMAKGAADMQADQMRAEGTQAEARSRVDAAMAQDENEFMQNYQEMMRDIRQKMAGIIEAQNATLNNIARA